MSWFKHGTSRIYYEEEGSGDPVLLLPGFAGQIDELSALRQALVAAKYRVIAADLPGSGRSEPQPRQYTSTYLEEDAYSFLALLQHLAVKLAHLIGFSDGGEVSLLMAAISPKTVRSVVTWGAFGVISDPSGQLRGALYNVVDDPIPPLQSFREYLVAFYGEANARTMTQNLATTLGHIIENGGDISLAKVGSIACPTLLIMGEHDPFAPADLLLPLASRIPTAKVVTLEDVGHDVHHARPEWLIQTILDWLR